MDEPPEPRDGDLIRTNQGQWFAYTAEHMADILDADSVDIYRSYGDTGEVGLRLGDVATIAAGRSRVPALRAA